MRKSSKGIAKKCYTKKSWKECGKKPGEKKNRLAAKEIFFKKSAHREVGYGGKAFEINSTEKGRKRTKRNQLGKLKRGMWKTTIMIMKQNS